MSPSVPLSVAPAIAGDHRAIYEFCTKNQKRKNISEVILCLIVAFEFWEDFLCTIIIGAMWLHWIHSKCGCHEMALHVHHSLAAISQYKTHSAADSPQMSFVPNLVSHFSLSIAVHCIGCVLFRIVHLINIESIGPSFSHFNWTNYIELDRIMATIETTELPALPANEKTYAGIPEAVFVVSYSWPFRKCVVANLKMNRKDRVKRRKKRKNAQKMCHSIRRHHFHLRKEFERIN